MTTIDFPTIDLSKIKLPFELPFDLPTIDVPSITVPSVDFGNVDVPSAEQIIEWFRDAVFAGAGLVALTAERVSDLQKQFVDLVRTQTKTPTKTQTKR
jgi:hypothetical protein